MDDRALFEQRIGTVLRGKWTLERLLGVGGMAAVYVALHKIGRRDAIKILHPEVARSEDLRRRFEQEAHAVNRLKHPGAVEIRDVDACDDGTPFLVMELLEGESLAERAQRLGGIATEEMLRIMDELLDVLATAHDQGIVHRDIKLDNLFVQRHGRLKVLDFGIARLRWGASPTVRTRLGATLGTAAYMAPEQVRGGDVDHRVDLFAAGATLFRLVARRRIHEAATEGDLLQKMATHPAPPLCSVATGVPRGLCLVVDRALAFDRDLRYPDARTMQLDVQSLRRGDAPPYATARADAEGAPTGRGGEARHGMGPPATTRDAPAPAADALLAFGTAPTAAQPNTAFVPGASPGTATAVGSQRPQVAAPSAQLPAGGSIPAPASAPGAPPASWSPRSVAVEPPANQTAVEATLRSATPTPLSVASRTPTGRSAFAAGGPGGAPVSVVAAPSGFAPWQAAMGPDSPADRSARQPSPQRSSNAAIIVAGAAMISCGVGIGLYFGLREPAPPSADTGSPSIGDATSAARSAAPRSDATAPGLRPRPPTTGAAAPAQAAASSSTPPPAGTTAAGRPGKRGNDRDPKGKNK